MQIALKRKPFCCMLLAGTCMLLSSASCYRLIHQDFLAFSTPALIQGWMACMHLAGMGLAGMTASDLYAATIGMQVLYYHLFACRCLLAKCYNAAMPLLSSQPEKVDPAETAMTSRSFLLYCYYGAMIYIGALLSHQLFVVFVAKQTLQPALGGTHRVSMHAHLDLHVIQPLPAYLLRHAAGIAICLICHIFRLFVSYAGRKQYPDALRMLLHALTAPTFVVNAITMAAHKKHVLVSLIHAGGCPRRCLTRSSSRHAACHFNDLAACPTLPSLKDDLGTSMPARMAADIDACQNIEQGHNLPCQTLPLLWDS